jgi:hypothetical protein
MIFKSQLRKETYALAHHSFPKNYFLIDESSDNTNSLKERIHVSFSGSWHQYPLRES